MISGRVAVIAPLPRGAAARCARLEAELASTSSVCAPSAGPCQRTSPGVSESFGTMPGIFTGDAAGQFGLQDHVAGG